jgi:hypothetical protein
MASIPRTMSPPMPCVLTIGLVEQNPRKLFIVPLQGYGAEDLDPCIPAAKTILTSTASAWKILDVVRLAAICLGVLSFPSGFPLEKIPSGIPWISVHTTPADEFDRSSEWESENVDNWSGREIWLRIHGGNSHSSMSRQVASRPGFNFSPAEPVEELLETLITRIASVSDPEVP